MEDYVKSNGEIKEVSIEMEEGYNFDKMNNNSTVTSIIEKIIKTRADNSVIIIQ